MKNLDLEQCMTIMKTLFDQITVQYCLADFKQIQIKCLNLHMQTFQ